MNNDGGGNDKLEKRLIVKRKIRLAKNVKFNWNKRW